MVVLIVLGGVCASFVYALTSAKNVSFLYRRSICDSCRRPLKWYELIPILSFIFLKGRCPVCREKIPVSNFIVEMLTIIVFLAPIFFQLSLNDLTLYYLIVLFLVPLSIFDFETFTIPNHINLIFLFTGLFLTNLQYLDPLGDFAAILVLHLFYFLFYGSVGYGDIKLFSVLTLITPLNFFLYIVMFTYLIGGLFVVLINLYKSSRVDKVPLVPFITNGVMIVFFLYEDIHLIYTGGFL
ncbi:prepilin peptidase [Lacicoccus alkaliphilus]|uniref:Leader peptidase (Prepilin peptidase) / N-methyltransferase n=1 Tax=Lacicoccus alkaliphilus DSM 16010 TaxID=1123231 RepID=A0A1M7BX16_9BACL|nr:A24 family peptidase [Salinicoccus alkaliphilus]SHL59139.1 leader peptidase (prepilin peptidase) / N-methyltransferase [Salinicoccus alkaliphilus DSM 16010]